MAIEELRILAILGWGVALIFCMGFFAMWFLARESLELAGVILANYRNLVNSLPAKLRATEWRPFEYATVGIVPSAAPVVTELSGEVTVAEVREHFPDAVASQPEPDSWQVGFRNLADITGEAFCELSAIVGFAMEPHLHDWTGLIVKVREAVSRPEGTREFADTAEMDRHYICEIGRLFWGNNKDCYAASAVYRKVKSSLASPTPVVSGQAELVIAGRIEKLKAERDRFRGEGCNFAADAREFAIDELRTLKFAAPPSLPKAGETV